jgi:hypothetical protein
MADTKTELLREIDTLSPKYLSEILDFVEFIKYRRGIPDTMLMSEAALAKDWDTSEEDAAWAYLDCELNEETLASIREVDAGRGIHQFNTAEEMFEVLGL